jgi:hypothetical protein
MKTEELWRELSASPELPAFRRVDDSHPLNIYAGVAEDLSPLLLLVSADRIAVDERLQSLRVDRHSRDDGDWSYTVSLDEGSLRPLFALLCDDLVESTRKNTSTSSARYFFQRLARWRALLASGSTGLSEEEIRGLLGELYALSELLAPMFGIETAILAWCGPTGEEQDFRLKDRAFEVKAISPGKVKVQISSLRQLEIISGRLDLIVVPINPAPPNQGDTIADFVERISALIASDFECTKRWEDSLLLAGFTDTDPGVRRPYAIARPLFFCVDQQFPRLTASNIPIGIVDAKYTLDLSFYKSNERDFLI